jgi:hypothetical protein
VQIADNKGNGILIGDPCHSRPTASCNRRKRSHSAGESGEMADVERLSELDPRNVRMGYGRAEVELENSAIEIGFSSAVQVHRLGGDENSEVDRV